MKHFLEYNIQLLQPRENDIVKKKEKTKFEELDIVIKISLKRLIYLPEQTSLNLKKKRRIKIIKMC